MDSADAVEEVRQAYEATIADQLCAALAEATHGQIINRQAEHQFDEGLRRLDLLLTLQAGGDTVDIAVETLRNAYPRDVRQAIWQLDEYRLATGERDNLVTLVAADSLSPGAKELLRKRGLGYFERTGSLYLRWRQWLINIDRPARAQTKKEIAALFTDARETVVHALLQHRNEWLTGGELAELTQTSSYTCSVVLQELERREWVETSGAGRTLRRRLVEPGHLLDAWAEQWTKRKESRSRWYTFPDRPGDLLAQLGRQINEAKVSFVWAFTGTAAANIRAPLLTNVDTAEIVVQPGYAEQLIKLLNMKPAEKGANVTLIERDGASLLFRERHPETTSCFASPFILYLDLLDGRGRNKELAQHLREQLKL